MKKKRSQRKAEDSTPRSQAETPARSRRPETVRRSSGTDNPRVDGAPTPAPSMQLRSSPAALNLLLDEVHHLIDFGESMIAEYKANPHLNANDRFAKLEAWLAILTEKVFPGLVPAATDTVLEPAATIGFRAGSWIPASLDRLERPAVAAALRALDEQTTAWKNLFPFVSKNRPSLGRGPRLVELPDDSVDEAALRLYEEELERWSDALKSTNKRVIEAMNEFIGPFKRLRGHLVDQLL